MKFRAGPNKMEIEHLHGDDEVIVHDFKANCICGICGMCCICATSEAGTGGATGH